MKILSTIITLCISLLFVSCGQKELGAQKFKTSNAIENRASNYAVVNNLPLIDINFINDENHFELLNGVELPVLSLDDYQINSTYSDGKYLYVNGRYYGLDKDGKIIREKLIYRIDVNDGTVLTLVSEKSTSNVRNNDTIVVHDGYLYFFMEKEDRLNDVCRVNIDGGNVEKLTDNQNEIYCGIFFTEDEKIYYLKSDYNFYEVVDGNFENGKIVRENLYTVTYENGKFYSKLQNGQFIMFSQESLDDEEIIDIDMYGGRYLVKDGKIYYVKNIPQTLGIDSENDIEAVNSTQGKVFMYDTATRKNILLVENSQLDILSILDVNEEVLLVHANTNDAILGNSYGNENGSYWYININDGSILEITHESAG